MSISVDNRVGQDARCVYGPFRRFEGGRQNVWSLRRRSIALACVTVSKIDRFDRGGVEIVLVFCRRSIALAFGCLRKMGVFVRCPESIRVYPYEWIFWAVFDYKQQV